MAKNYFAALFLIALTFACTQNTPTNTDSDLSDEMRIVSFTTTTNRLQAGQNFNVLLTLQNSGLSEAKNVKTALISNIDESNIVSASDAVAVMRAGESRNFFWTIEAPSIGVPGDISYFLESRVYYDYEIDAFADVVFIPTDYIGSPQSATSGSSKGPVEIVISSNSPIITFKNNTEFDLSVKINNVGDGRVGYLSDDLKNENSSLKNIITDINIVYPKTWNLLEPEKWINMCAAPDNQSPPIPERTECQTDADCGVSPTCYNGDIYEIACLQDQCVYERTTNCDSKVCTSLGNSCAPQTCRTKNVIKSRFDKVNESFAYQRHRLASGQGSSFVVPFSREEVESETVESVIISANYSYVIDSEQTLSFVVEGK